MSFLTYGDIQVARKSITDSSKRLFESKQPTAQTVFLSHSWRDQEHIEGVISFLAQFEATTYVDERDNRLPDPPSSETAKILRDTIQVCSRLIVLVTPNSRTSKWIPWELGIADGMKGVWREALLPLVPGPHEENWASQEYFGLYPRIIKGPLQGYYGDVWKVYNPRTKTNWELKEWLHNPKVG